MSCTASLVMLGCKQPDAIYFAAPGGSIEVSIAAEQSDLCHKDCSTEASQVSPEMSFVIGRRGDGGIPEGPVGPGVYRAPAPDDGGPGVFGFEVAGVCDQVPGWPKYLASGTVTLTHVPSRPDEHLEGSYQLDPDSGASYGFTAGTFSARACP
jgi:hypothetical protein